MGESQSTESIFVQTKDVPMKREGLIDDMFLSILIDRVYSIDLDLPELEYSIIDYTDRSLNYRLNNDSFNSLKVPLCLRFHIYNHSNVCEHIVTSSGVIKLAEPDLFNVLNVSICLYQYEDYCGQTRTVEISE